MGTIRIRFEEVPGMGSRYVVYDARGEALEYCTTLDEAMESAASALGER